MGSDLGPIRAVADSVEVVDGNAEFAAYNRARTSGDAAATEAARAALDALLAEADVLCMMYPMLAEVVAKAPRLKWLHHTQAGVSNLWSSDVWTAGDVLITSGRGHVRPTAIAEYCIAAALEFARGLNDGHIDKRAGALDHAHYAPQRVAGATMGVVGLGGIGGEVARLARALGMRVVATRRSAETPRRDAGGADLLLPASALDELAERSDFVAVTTALTRETRNLIGGDFFAAAAKRPVLVNVSRGEVVDEDALLAALGEDRLRGAVLDVYAGELEGRPPRAELLTHPRVLLTPHISGLGDKRDPMFMDLFCENLRRYVAGETLINVVDRDRGY